MTKLYNFRFDNKINRQEWSLVLDHNFRNVFDVTWSSEYNCFFYSEDNINQTLGELIPIIENDLACQLTVLVSHLDNKLSDKALSLAVKFNSGKLINLADICLLAVNERQTDFILYIENYFSKIDEELLRTMAAYLANNSSGLKTANNLYIHRNTMLYRLSKFYQLTKLDLHDYDDASFFSFWLSWQKIKTHS